ncbi:MAG: hypothetical protein FWF52_00820 [Candidatus Azobacteroides sp.]|nr:hypothetical protein [Candidatus Azobacteroides sp.]
MKKNIFYLFFIFLLFVSCQNHWQTVKYNGVSVQIPSDWGNKNTINLTNLNYKYADITEHLISCWSKETINGLAIQWIDAEVDDDLYIETDIEWKQERFPMYRQLQFDEIVGVDFLGFKAKKCHFYGNLMKDVSIEGEYIAFTKNGHSYIVLIHGDKHFYKSNDYNYILNNIEPNFLGITQQKERNTKIIVVDDNFTRYEFRNYNLSVPNTMELRDENSFISLGKEIIIDNLRSIKKIDINYFNFVFQPAGMDDIQNSEEQKKALKLYARVLISYKKGDSDDFFRWNGNITYTQAEYNELNKTFKDNLLNEIKRAKQMDCDLELLNFSNIKIAKNVNKFVYIKQEYERKGLNGNVKVADYYLYNNNEMVKLTISYRISESNLWEIDFNKIIDTFSFTTKKIKT